MTNQFRRRLDRARGSIRNAPATMALLAVILILSSCAGADGENGSQSALIVFDDGVKFFETAIGTPYSGPPELMSNTWYDPSDIGGDENHVVGGTAYDIWIDLEVEGEAGPSLFEDGADGQDFFHVRYASTSGYILYVFTERFNPEEGPQSDPVMVIAVDGAGPASLNAADLDAVPFGPPESLPYADTNDVPDQDGDGYVDISDFDQTGYATGGVSGDIQTDSDMPVVRLVDEDRLDAIPGTLIYLSWFARRYETP